MKPPAQKRKIRSELDSSFTQAAALDSLRNLVEASSSAAEIVVAHGARCHTVPPPSTAGAEPHTACSMHGCMD